MPALYSAGICMSLATLPLAETITPSIAIKKGHQASRQVTKAEESLTHGYFLEEQRVQFPGDEENFSMNWLNGAPFLQVLAGEESAWKVHDEVSGVTKRTKRRDRAELRVVARSKENSPEAEKPRSFGRSTRSMRSDSHGVLTSKENTPEVSVIRSRLPAHAVTSLVGPNLLHMAASPSPSAPVEAPMTKALALHIMLSQKTFYRSLDDDKPQHLKIEVFFNAQLASSVLVNQNDLRCGAKSMHQTFAGTRVDIMAERPWVIVPPGQNVDGSLRSARKTTGVQDRWQQICRELMKESKQRGVDENGDMSPTAQYLKALAGMMMPSGVADMQKPGGRRFGVVDVIVTVGKGYKVTDGVRYAKAPMRLVDEKYSYEIVQELGKTQIGAQPQSMDKVLNENVGESTLQINEQADLSTDQDAEGESDPESSVLLPGLEAYASASPALHDSLTGPHLTPNASTHDSTHFVSTLLPHAVDLDLGLPLISTGRHQPDKSNYSELEASTNVSNTRDEERKRSPSRQHPGLSITPSPTTRTCERQRNPCPQFNLNQYDGFVHANPYQTPYTDMMVGLDCLGSGLSSVDELASSPHQLGFSEKNTIPLLKSSSSGPMDSAECIFPPLASNPYTTAPSIIPGQTRKVSFGQTNITSFNSHAPPNETPGSLDLAIQGPLSQRSVLESSPLLHHRAALFQPIPHFVSPCIPLNRAPPGKLPPLGYFAGPKKVKTMSSVQTTPVDENPFRGGILVKRLVINGQSGKVIDHHWKTPQLVLMKRSPVSEHQVLQEDHDKMARKSQESIGDINSTSVQLRHPSGRFASIATPLENTDSSSMPNNAKSNRRDSLHAELAVRRQATSTSNLRALAPKPPVQSNEVMADNYVSTANSASRVSKRRRTTSHGITSIQGPKATKFVYDDPEELLRKKPRKSECRSLSPMKIDPAPTGSENIVQEAGRRTVHHAVSRDFDDIASSSSLSSALSSPELRGLGGLDGVDEMCIPSLSSTFPLMPVRASEALAPEAATTTAEKTVPPITTPTATKQPVVPSKAPSIQPAPSAISRPTPPPPTTPSPVKKKVSALMPSSTPLTKERRSPSRLLTVDNPPLNQDCRIQYAVSVDKTVESRNSTKEKGKGTKKEQEEKGTGGVLRQVRGERQGMFSEESVVMGVRFFIPG
jgi:hypothetical protein